MGNDIPSNPGDVTGSDPQEHQPGGDPMQPGNSQEAELDPKTKEGFQRLIAKKEREAREAQERAEAAQRELKVKKLQELDETDRLRQEREELAQENAQLKLSRFAMKELSKRNIPLDNPIAEIALETPWAIPYVKRGLGDSPSWSDVIRVVEERLPTYLDTLESKNDNRGNSSPATPASDSPKPTVDPERQPGSGSKRVWSQREIDKMSIEEYAKYSKDIHDAMVEGRITP